MYAFFFLLSLFLFYKKINILFLFWKIIIFLTYHFHEKNIYVSILAIITTKNLFPFIFRLYLYSESVVCFRFLQSHKGHHGNLGQPSKKTQMSHWGPAFSKLQVGLILKVHSGIYHQNIKSNLELQSIVVGQIFHIYYINFFDTIGGPKPKLDTRQQQIYQF